MVLSLFTWSDGKYLFEPGALPTQEAITLDWDTPGAVLQGLRGLPLNYIRPLAPPKDSVIERSADTSILAELQLNSAEQKLLALLLGRHPMEQLLALDFIANESLLRGLVTFAALGLITVHPGAARHEIPEDNGEGETIDPMDTRPPAYVKAPTLAPDPAHYAPKKIQSPDNRWPDPAPAPAPAPARKKFVPGPALAAFEAESSPPPPASQEDEGVFRFAPPDEEGPSPAAAEESFAAAQKAFAAWSSQNDKGAGGPGTVPRALYESLLAEKQELQQRLYTALDERNTSDKVPRELFDQVQAEKRQLQEKMMLMLDELLRLRQQPGKSEPEERGPNVRPFPGSRKNE
jgi:hypothetical protein